MRLLWAATTIGGARPDEEEQVVRDATQPDAIRSRRLLRRRLSLRGSHARLIGREQIGRAHV